MKRKKLRMPKPMLVGESNPGASEMRYALYPSPNGCSGYRLCTRIFDMTPEVYLETFQRTNIFLNYAGPWRKEHKEAAKERAQGILARHEGLIIPLGKRVAEAFGWTVFFEEMRWGTHDQVVILPLPHPSGLCRLWNEPGNIELARKLVGRWL